jgi:DNA ligase-1
MAAFREVAELADQMAATSSRLSKRAAIAEAMAKVNAQGADDTGIFCLYLAGLAFSEADPRKLNAGGAMLTKVLLAISGATDAGLRAAFRRHGDLGSAAFDLLVERDAQPAPRAEAATRDATLSLSQVAEAFAAMATARTTAIRTSVVEQLLRRATPIEAKYLLKLMLGDMRIGVKESLVEEAIAVAAGVEVAAVRNAVMLEADLGKAAERAFAGTLAEARMRLFHPLGFMLASPVETPEEAIERFTAKPDRFTAKPPQEGRGESAQAAHNGDEADMEAGSEADPSETSIGIPVPVPDGAVRAFLEDKFDGMRAQLHFACAAQPGRVALYSRNREDITASFPELVEAFARIAAAGSGIILDGEILGWEFATGQALPFAVMGQRIGRKRVDNALRGQVPVVFMAFDLLFIDDRLQLERPLRERRNRLEALAESVAGLAKSPLVLSESAARAQEKQASLLFEPEAEQPAVPRLMLSDARLVETAAEIDRAYAEARARANARRSHHRRRVRPRPQSALSQRLHLRRARSGRRTAERRQGVLGRHRR